MSRARVCAVVMMIAVTGGLAHAARTRGPQLQPQLNTLPLQLGAWTGRESAPFDEDTLRVLGADSYLTRSYTASSGSPVDLYIAYYNRQRPGVSIHSPLHCLPGTGWEPLDIATVAVAQPDERPGEARRLIVTKNQQRAVVFYWYQVHGRMIASEIASKGWLLHDSLLRGRSDAALVRIVVPVHGAELDAAQREGLAFAHDVLPYLPHLWS
jgi:EpsI family protein